MEDYIFKFGKFNNELLSSIKKNKLEYIKWMELHGISSQDKKKFTKIYVLGEKIYASKKQIKEYFKKYLLEMKNKHPNINGTTIKINDVEIENQIRFLYTRRYKLLDENQPFYIHFIRGWFCFYTNNEPFSVDTCLYDASDDKENTKNVIQALRDDIQYQINDFRENCEFQLTCDLCGIFLDCNLPMHKYKKPSNNSHIDHIITFKKLSDDFLRKYELLPECNKIGNQTTERTLTDDTIRENWKEYHKINAKLRKICQICNLSRKTI